MAVLGDYGGAAFTLSELAELAGVTTSVVKGLVKQGVVAEEEAPRDLPYPRLDPDLPGKDLADDQRAAAAQLSAAVELARIRGMICYSLRRVQQRRDDDISPRWQPVDVGGRRRFDWRGLRLCRRLGWLLLFGHGYALTSGARR